MKLAILLLIILHSPATSLSAQVGNVVQPTARDSAVADRVAGCYQLVGDAWRSDSALAKIESIPPDKIRFELTKRPAPGWSELSNYEHVVYFEVRSDSIAGWEHGLFTSWVRLPGEQPRILVSRPLPMAGFALRLTQRGTDLVGTITAFTDAIPPDGKSEASHAITARRIRCAVPRRGTH